MKCNLTLHFIKQIMIEIFEKLNKNNEQEATEISLLINPKNYFGSSIVNEHRLLFFEEIQNEPVYIDFFEQIITTNKLYIVPSKHLLYIPFTTTNFQCFVIPDETLNDFERYWIYMFKYQSEKSIDYEKNHVMMCQTNLISNLIELPTINTNSFQHLVYAKTFCELLGKSNITHSLSINIFLQKLYITQPTLWRVCNSIFNTKPQNILRYHLLLKAIFMLLSKREMSLNIISDNLGFKDQAIFSRFIKVTTNLSPTDIREKHKHIVI